MSVVIRQFLVFFLIVLVVKCSQGYTISYPDDNDLNEGFEPMRQPRFGAPRGGKRSEPYQEIDEFDFIRIGRSRPKDRLGFLRIGKSDPTKRESFLRIGRGSPEEDESGYIRMGRPADLDKKSNFLRIGRGSTKADIPAEESEFLRIGRSRPKRPETRNSFLRIGRAGPGYNLTADDMKFLLNHRQDVMNFLQNSNVTHLLNGYFALPRQGRAMSFYFPRLGRSGDDVTEDTDCCPEGVRNVFAANKGSFEICPRAKSCCGGLQEKTKLYSNTVLVECTRDTSLEKIRELINEK